MQFCCDNPNHVFLIPHFRHGDCAEQNIVLLSCQVTVSVREIILCTPAGGGSQPRGTEALPAASKLSLQTKNSQCM